VPPTADAAPVQGNRDYHQLAAIDCLKQRNVCVRAIIDKTKLADLTVTEMSALVQTGKNAVSANVVRVSPESGPCSMQSHFAFVANNGLV
jgi:hypothetical protein